MPVYFPPLPTQTVVSGGAMVPTYLGPLETFTIPEHRQALAAMAIDNEGTLTVDGFLIEVD